MNTIVDGEPDFIGVIGGIIMLVLLLVAVSNAGNVSVYDSGSDYIIWSVGGDNRNISVDGIPVEVSGSYYGQYDLSPESKHIGCDSDGECLPYTTSTNGYSVFSSWLVYFILIGLCVASYFVPLSYAATVVYGIYLIGSYLPSHNAGYTYYLLVGILLIMGLLAGARGLKK